jgi:hypothetical protein
MAASTFSAAGFQPSPVILKGGGERKCWNNDAARIGIHPRRLLNCIARIRLHPRVAFATEPCQALALFSAYRASPTCVRGETERRAAHQPCALAEAHASLAKDARLPALHRGDFCPRARVSVHGIYAVDRAASSSRPARSGRRAGSQGLPSASLRGSPAGAAPNSANRTSPEDAPRQVGMEIGLYSGPGYVKRR